MNAHVLSQLSSLFACCFTLLVLLLAQDGQLAHESLSAEDKLSVASATVSLTATAWWTPSKKQLGTVFGFGFTQDQVNPAHNEHQRCLLSCFQTCIHFMVSLQTNAAPQNFTRAKT